LGVKVTVVELLEDILGVVDLDIRHELRRHMEGTLGIRILAGKAMEAIRAGDRGVAGNVGDERVEAELMLASVGRKPVTQGLALENAGLATAKNGQIEVDEYCRTRVACVYAVGDVTAGSTQLAHAATAQGLAAAENACGKTRRKAEKLVPASIYTSPEIGCVGLTEADAKKRGLDVRVGKFAFPGLGKAIAAGEPHGFVKWVVDAATDRLLGAHAIGPHATELVNEATVAIRAELTAEELGRTIHCHPTFSEAWMEAAHAAHGRCVHQPPSRRSRGGDCG
jgi:dihydrolipoamide dehydrogenase